MKNIDYLSWIKELDQASSKDYYQVLRRFINLLLISNSHKIKKLEEIIKRQESLLLKQQQISLDSLNPIYQKIKKAAFAEAINNDLDLREINTYEGIKSGKISVSPADNAEDLYTPIRITLEIFINSGRLYKFKRYMSTRDDNFYFCDINNFPKHLDYLNFREHLYDDFTEPIKEYRSLKMYLSWFGIGYEDDRYSQWFRKEIRAKLLNLILFFQTPEEKSTQYIKTDFGVKKLFNLTKSPPKIFYEGKNVAKRGSVKNHGKTQS